jgi:hypothetical protein
MSKTMQKTMRNSAHLGLAFILTLAALVSASGQRTSRPIRRGRTAPPPSSRAVPEVEDRRDPAFTGFPINKARTIDLEIDEDALDCLSEREKMDQIRDWLLLTIVSDSGTSAGVANKILYDLPSSRCGYMQPIGNFEYGDIRSRYLGKGQVIALLPQGDDSACIDQLAQIVDEHRKNNGERPSLVIVFEYKVSRPTQTAQIVRRQDIDAQELFTEKYGYREARIHGMSDLERFMGEVDDLTYATLDGDAVVLGGRKIKSQAYRGIRVQDVAAVWKSEQSIQTKLASFLARFNAIEKEYDESWQGFVKIVNYLSRYENDAANREINKLKDLYRRAIVSQVEALRPDGSQSKAPSPAITAYEGILRIVAAFNSNDVAAFNAEVVRLRKVR